MAAGTLGEEAVGLSPRAAAVLARLIDAYPALEPSAGPIAEAARRLIGCWRGGGTLFLCGNGGSHADALHIAGELVKSFEQPRPLGAELRAALEAEDAPYGRELAEGLQAGLRAVTLGANGAVASAIANDMRVPAVGLAQELCALGRRGDVLLALSTSGTSRSVLLAATVARALGMTTLGLVGLGRPGGGAGGPAPDLASLSDVAVVAPAVGTAEVQGWHVRIYHCICGIVEEELFGG